MSRRSWIIVVVVVALVATAVPIGWGFLSQRRESADKVAQAAAADAFANAWKGGALASLSYANSSGEEVAAAVQAITGGLTSAETDAPAEVTVGDVEGDDDNSKTVPLDISWQLAGDRTWSYATTLRLTKQDDAWLPEYQPSVIHPKVVAGATMKSVTQQPKRGQILGADDAVLVDERPVVVVGLQPSRADDVAASAEQIADIVDVDPAALVKRAEAAGPDAFVEAITLREAAYQEVRAELQSIPGAVFNERTLALAPTADFARAVIGTVGQATAEIVEESEGRVQAGDTTGLSGLQRTYDEQLAGKPGLAVELNLPAAASADAGADTTDADTTDTTDADTAAEPEQLFLAESVDGTTVRTTLDPALQQAADTALTKAEKPAAMVAIRASTGEVLAVANGGPNGSGYNRAFLGQYAPGSTFKVISGLGLLTSGVTPTTVIQCPATLNVGGREFKNAEDEVLGSVQFRENFANSCNTAFVGSSSRLTPAELAETAASLGYGQENKLGVPAFTGSVPDSGDAVSHAAAMIGQSTVLASPVTVAGAAAAVSSGTWHAPRLVLDPDPGLEEGTALPAKPAAELKELMRAVVTEGTATAMRSVPGGPVYGKTGTAQYGDEDPPEEHAWFTGFQGDIAFAVVVEGGGFGSVSAVPLVQDFLTQIAE